MASRGLLYLHLFLVGTAAALFYNIINAPKIPASTMQTYPLHIASYPQTDLPFKSIKLGHKSDDVPPVVCNLNICDLDNDQKNEVLICDTQAHAVLLGSFKHGAWHEEHLCTDLQAPACTHVCDIDSDGDNDILVAELGDVFPNDKLVGSVVLLTNNGGTFVKSELVTGLGRVADMRTGDFNSDGLLDLAVAVFGHGHGEVLLLTQGKDRGFTSTQLLDGPGCIHVPVADFNNDGHLDIACVLSQDEEEVWVLYNDGTADFSKQLVFKTLDDNFGSAGLVAADIDNDGDQDLLLPHGDNLEEFFHYPQAYHGCLLLRNEKGVFTTEKISDLSGCYAASVGDMDNDKDNDVVIVSMVNDWRSDQACSVAILRQENDGSFKQEQLASTPIKFITCAVGDLNHDGINDVIAGGFHIQPPFERASRLQLWLGGEQ